MKLFGYDFFFDIWDGWHPSNWQFGYQLAAERGDKEVWFGPFYLAASPLT